jgi:hypothetical protein
MTHPLPADETCAPRRVVLIVSRFFGYELEIAEELKRQGSQVDLLPDRPFDSALLKAATRVRPQLIPFPVQ